MPKLTPEELTEPDVAMMIPHDRWALIPAQYRDLLMRNYLSREGKLRDVFSGVPAYLAREIEEEARKNAEAENGKP